MSMPALFSQTWLGALFWATLYSTVPLVLAALGGVIAERAGVVNIALEGLILAGAFVGIWAGQKFPLLGLIMALGVGSLLGLLHALLTQKARVNPIVSGLAINLFVAGATRYLSLLFFPSGIQSAGLPKTLFLIMAVVLPILISLWLTCTRFGLRLRAVGESPESARMAGISPLYIRFIAMAISGMLAASAGAYLSISDANTFSRDMSSGKGYVALAAVIFGKWKPLGAAVGSLFFGFFYAVQTQLQISGRHIVWLGIEWTSPVLLDGLPYFMALLALLTFVGRATPPTALGLEQS